MTDSMTAGSSTAPPSSGALLQVRDLTVSFDTPHGVVTAVNGVSFDVAPRERLGIVGESGSGKSVTAQAILGLLRGATVTGEVIFDGRDLLTQPEASLRALRGWDMSYVFQDPLSALDPIRTIGDQVSQVLRLRNVSRKEAKERTVHMLERVGIRDATRRFNDYPHQFSGGMRQRVMIAMALIGEPRLVLADEPTTALDVRVQAQVMDLLHELTEEQHVAVVFITHDLGILAGFAERMLVMYAGRVVEQAEIDDLYYKPAHPYTRGLLGSLPRLGGDLAHKLQSIGGRPPAPINLPTGCAFNPRCRFAQDICRVERPPLHVPAGGGHPTACHFAGHLDDVKEVVS
jgi:oligopeptide/dipeptide ABC transporter ATP-binding protein